MSINLQLPKLTDLEPRLTVIGVGGAGCNAVNNMIAAGLTGVEFVVANTDAQALAASSAEHRIQLGVNLTEGLGAGARPEIGQAAAEEAVEEIRAQVSGSHMVFLAAGMGGGTGTGAAAVIARVAREQGILTVGVVTKPFQFEGSRRMRVAEAGVEELKQAVDTLIVIPNQNLFRIANEKTTFAEAFVLADHVLYSGVACIVDLIIKEGLINLDFADVRAVMAGMGTAMMGTGEASGERRATMAAEEAITNPLLDDISLDGAKGLLLSITGGPDLTLYEVDEAASRVRQEVDPEATIIVGATFDELLDDKIRVSIVASGMDRHSEQGNEGGFMGMRPHSSASAPQRSSLEGSAPPDSYSGAAPPNSFSGAAPPQPLESALQMSGRPGEQFDSYDVAVAPEAEVSVVPASPVMQQPPPVPYGGPQDVHARLSEAIQSGSQLAPNSDPSVDGVWGAEENRAGLREHDGGRSAHAHEQASGSPVQWQSGDGVTIEEGLPPMARQAGGAGARASQTGADNRGQTPVSAQFQPEPPPARVRRPVRRMPAVEDFPVVGQREYRARVGSPNEGSMVHDRGRDPSGRTQQSYGHPQSQPQPQSNPQPQPVRKKGLFERLTGITRKQSDSFLGPDAGAQQAQNYGGDAQPHHQGVSGGPTGRDARPGDRPHEQRAELPEFFGRRRKG